jgi:hypothetical protein
MTSHNDPGRAPEPPEPHEHGVRSEDDRVASGKVVFVGVASLVVFFVASWLAVSYFRLRQGEHGPIPIPPEVGQSKIGIVEQQMFDVAVRGQRDRAARLERLQSFGWVDRSAGIVHLPIDRAMGLVAQGVRPKPDVTPPERAAPGAQP